MRLLFFLLIVLLFAACSSKSKVHQPKHSSNTQKDLGIGLSPTPPPNEQVPGEKSRLMLVDMEGRKTPVSIPDANAQKIDKNVSNPVSIMSSSGGLLTLWARKPGNWVWGYTPIDSFEFGEARYWRIISFSNGQVMIKNEAKGTCLQAYKNGAIHEICDNKNQDQLWNFNFFDNQAIQIQSVSAKTCLQTPTIRTTTHYSIYLTKCATSSNFDQQWYITPVSKEPDPIFFIR